MRWRIVYRDGTSFSHADGPPEAAPGLGVAVIAHEDPNVGVELLRGEAFYAYDEEYLGGWQKLDVFGLCQYLGRPGFKVIKVGDNMPTKDFLALVESLRKDPRLPPKSARYPWEAPS